MDRQCSSQRIRWTTAIHVTLNASLRGRQPTLFNSNDFSYFGVVHFFLFVRSCNNHIGQNERFELN